MSVVLGKLSRQLPPVAEYSAIGRSASITVAVTLTTHSTSAIRQLAVWQTLVASTELRVFGALPGPGSVVIAIGSRE